MFAGPHSTQLHSTCGNIGELASRHRLSFTGREAFSAIGRDRSVDNGAAVYALPGIKNKKEV